MYTKSVFLQGVYVFEGHGLQQPFLLTPELNYTVAADTALTPVGSFRRLKCYPPIGAGNLP